MPSNLDNNNRIVYSTETGRIRPENLKKNAPLPAGDGIVRLRREKKGRGGKIVTTISGIQKNSQELKALLKLMQKHCGSGGTIKNGIIEIQGDHLDTLLAMLGEQGFKAKHAGG